MHWPYAFVINIQKDANKRKLIQAGRTNLAVYTCTKFAVRFVYVDTNNSERSWQILYVNHLRGYVNGNADNQNLLIAITYWVERTDFDQVVRKVRLALATPFGNCFHTSSWKHHVVPAAVSVACLLASDFTCLKVILSGNCYHGNVADPPARVKPPWDTKI